MLIFFPVGENVADPRAICQLEHLLKVLLGNLKWLGRDVGNILPNQFAWVDAGLVDLLEQEAAERLHAGAEEGAVERYIDAFEWDRGKTAL